MAVASDAVRYGVRKYHVRTDRRVIAVGNGARPICAHRTGPTVRTETRQRDTWDMAGQAQRGSRGHGRSSRPGSSLPRAEAASAAGPWARIQHGPPPEPRRRQPRHAAPATRPVYRLLLMKGLTPTEAANLTAFICGLSTSDLRWSLKQVNQLLFLRAMRQAGRFGGTDGAKKRTH